MQTKLKTSPDVLVKFFFRQKRKFSSIINAALFEGVRVLDYEKLELLDTDESGLIEERQDSYDGRKKKRYCYEDGN